MEEPIKGIIGEELSAVSFVCDYVEFHFNGQIVRALTPPTVVNKSGSFTFPETGSRDNLCFLIGNSVVSISGEDGEDLFEMVFQSGEKVSIPLAHDKRTGPEAMHYVSLMDSISRYW